MSWGHFLIPLAVLYFFTKWGKKTGQLIILRSLVISLTVGTVTGHMGVMLFAAVFVPAGFVLYASAETGLTPWQAGGRTFLALAAGWMVFWTMFAMVNHSNPYTDVLASIDMSLEAAYPVYLKAANVPEDLGGEMAATFDMLRRTIPKIFPAVLAVSGLCIVWFNLIGSTLLWRVTKSDWKPWPEFSDWRLPESTVWAVISAALLLFLPADSLRTSGLNGTIVLFFLYFFQGLAVLATLLQRWTVPSPMKILIYILLLIQGYGFFLLAAVGLADTWMNFKKTREEPTG